MADKTEIAWCDSTFNPWIGCTKVSPGCDNCYAEREFDHRHRRAKWGAGQERSRTSAHNWNLPIRWNRQPFHECPECGWRGAGPVAHSVTTGEMICPTLDCTGRLKPARRRVFCASLSDVFDNEVPRQWRIDLFRLILDTPNIDWLLLTKRIGNAAKMLQDTAECIGPMMDANDRYKPIQNVWIGASIVNQEEADRDTPKLLNVPADVRFISVEPLLGPMCLRNFLHPRFRQGDDPEWQDLHAPLDWVIVGGESGPKARPMSPDWVRSLRDQCNSAGVPFLFKQWGEWAPNWLNDDSGLKIAGSEWMDKMGKKVAGRLLDCEMHNEFPAAENRCKKCGGIMRDGIAMGQTWSAGTPDFPGDNSCVTVSPGGPGRLIDCMKCEACGWSMT